MIIGLSGYIGSGKDTVGNIIRYLDTAKTLLERKEIDTIVPFSKYNEKEMLVATNWEIKKFAYKLKQIASILTGIPQEKFEDQEFKRTVLGDEWSTQTYKEDIRLYHPMLVREFLQKLGTDAIRDGLHPNTWVNALMSEYKQIHISKGIAAGPQYPNWIITDVRFPNEAQAIKDKGGVVVRINRNDFIAGRPLQEKRHPSETSLDNWEFDYGIDNNSDIEELTNKVKLMMNVMEII